MNIPADLLAGDILLYYSTDLVDELIAWKEGDALDRSKVAHVEIFSGAGQSWASRNGIGVNTYPFRPDGLVAVRRPKGNFNAADAKAVADSMKGTPYGFGDIAAVSGLDLKTSGVDCSHYAAMLMVEGLCPQFDDGFPMNEITPRDFLLSRESFTVPLNPPTPPPDDADAEIQ